MKNKNDDHVLSSNNKPIFTSDDFVVNKSEDGEVQSGGYKIENYFMSGGMPVMKTSNSKSAKNKIDGQTNVFSDLFKDLAVPAGLLYIKTPMSMFQPTIGYDRKSIEDDEVVDESLYDRLVKLAAETNDDIKKHKKTRRGNVIKNNKTKRRKN